MACHANTQVRMMVTMDFTLISAAILSIARTVLMPTGAFAVNAGLAVSLVIFAIALFLVLKKKTHPVLIIVMGAALGIAAGYMGLLPV